MRLLSSRYWEIKEFFGASIPPYAILSHTWGPEEISYQELAAALGALNRGELTPQGLELRDGFRKIKSALMQAAEDEFDWVWVDTCCIDKTSSAELTEAINSMFRWYQESQVCYAYLSDVEHGVDPAQPESSFQRSRWFTRGWTLQELLAPSQVWFFTSTWSFLGERSDLSDTIGEVTKIQPRFLSSQEPILHEATIAQRMSWAARRHTTRVEDAAYCMLGIFDINMPLLYGEGTKAFKRLQQEIIKNSHDLSIFAWDVMQAHPDSSPLNERSQLLAQSPADFEGCDGIVSCHLPRNSSMLSDFELTKRGLRIQLPVVYDKRAGWGNDTYRSYALLDCRFCDDFDQIIALQVQFAPVMNNGPSAHRQNTGQQVVRIRWQPSRTFLISEVSARKADILPLLFVDEEIPRSLVQLLYSHEWSPEHDLSCLYFATPGYHVLASPPVLVRQHSEVSRVELSHDAPLEVLNRGLSCIVRQNRASDYQLNPLYAHFRCRHRTQYFILRVGIQWTRPSGRLHDLAYSTGVPEVWRLIREKTVFGSLIKTLRFLVRPDLQKRKVCAMLSSTCELPHQVDPSSQQLKWSSFLEIGDQRLYITAKEELVMGNRIFVVSFDEQSRTRIRRISQWFLSSLPKLGFNDEGRGQLPQQTAVPIVARFVRPTEVRRILLSAAVCYVVSSETLFLCRRGGFGIVLSLIFLLLKLLAIIVDLFVLFCLLPVALIPRVRGQFAPFSSIVFVISGFFTIACHLYPSESKEERPWEDLYRVNHVVMSMMIPILAFFEFLQ